MISLGTRAPARATKIQPHRAKKSRRLLCGFSAGLSWLTFCMLISNPAMALDTKQSVKAIDAGAVRKNVESPINYSGILYKSGNRRDPFLNPITLRKKSKLAADEEADRGLAPPGMAGTYIAQAKLQGISIQDRGRVAIVRGTDARAYFLREGDRLFDGYLKTIESDSIILVRETKMKSGKTMTQDVTMRLRTP